MLQANFNRLHSCHIKLTSSWFLSNHYWALIFLLLYFLLRPLLHCICEILCMSTRWVLFLVLTVQKLSSREEKNYWLSCDSKPGLAGGKQECHLCAMQIVGPL